MFGVQVLGDAIGLCTFWFASGSREHPEIGMAFDDYKERRAMMIGRRWELQEPGTHRDCCVPAGLGVPVDLAAWWAGFKVGQAEASRLCAGSCHTMEIGWERGDVGNRTHSESPLLEMERDPSSGRGSWVDSWEQLLQVTLPLWPLALMLGTALQRGFLLCSEDTGALHPGRGGECW